MIMELKNKWKVSSTALGGWPRDAGGHRLAPQWVVLQARETSQVSGSVITGSRTRDDWGAGECGGWDRGRQGCRSSSDRLTENWLLHFRHFLSQMFNTATIKNEMMESYNYINHIKNKGNNHSNSSNSNYFIIFYYYVCVWDYLLIWYRCGGDTVYPMLRRVSSEFFS